MARTTSTNGRALMALSPVQQAPPTGLGPGTYTVTVTDERNLDFVFDTELVAQSNFAITNVNELSNYGGFQVSGTTVCDGVASVAFSGQVSGIQSIVWSNNVTTASNTTLCGGAYGVTVRETTDGLGCASVWTDALTVPPGNSCRRDDQPPSQYLLWRM